MESVAYQARRGELHEYFDRTAMRAWERLTSDAPVSGIRATVRAGRDAMRATLLAWLPADLTGLRLFDAGCGTGALAIEAAQRGADVVATDIAPALVKLAQDRAEAAGVAQKINFSVGDMLDPTLGRFDHVVAMDSLIHYRPADTVDVLDALAQRTEASIVFTFAPRTPMLATMHFAGRFFPRGDRAPAIVPVADKTLRGLIAQRPELAAWTTARDHRVATGFYTSHALELRRR